VDALLSGDPTRARRVAARFEERLAAFAGPPDAPDYAARLASLREEAAAQEAVEYGAVELALRRLERAATGALPAWAARRDAMRRRIADRAGALDPDAPRVPGLAFARVAAGRPAVGTPPAETAMGRDPNLEIAPREVEVEEFWIARTETTREVWRAHGRTTVESAEGDEWLPAADMTFDEASAFCDALEAVDPRFDFRLPTEVEWEVACRAGLRPERGPIALGAWEAATPPEGSQWKFALESYAVYDPHGRSGMEAALPVASRAPNPLGLYDMHGNLQEWCARSEGVFPYPDAAREPTRGGCFVDGFNLCRAGARGFHVPGNPKPTVGFRVVATRRSGP
jgi:formylglycine-generating enzyme required for sulfatase activity